MSSIRLRAVFMSLDPFPTQTVLTVMTVAGESRREREFDELREANDQAQQALLEAHETAKRDGAPELYAEYLLLALLQQQGGVVPALLRKAGRPAEPFIENTERHCDENHE